MNGIFKCITARIPDKINAKIVETVADLFKNDLRSNYLDHNEVLKLAMFNIVE